MTNGWEYSRETLSRFDSPGPAALGQLLESLEPSWGLRVVSRTSMLDLLFTNVDEAYPFFSDVRVSWEDGVFTFKLHRQGLLVTADRSRELVSSLVLESFLHQLLAERLDPVDE